MKTLTVKQPWASLIVAGIKDIENRTWKTNLRGRIYVHAGAQSFKSLVSSCLTFEQSEACGYEFAKMGLKRSNDVSTFLHSAIIGEVDIIDCVQNHPSVWAEKGVWNWVLANPVKYDQPILNIKGTLSFWEYRKEESSR